MSTQIRERLVLNQEDQKIRDRQQTLEFTFSPEQIAELVSANPQSQVYNPAVYEQLKNFDPRQFHPINVAWVQEGDGQIVIHVVDGHNRLWFAHEHPEVLAQHGISVRALDVTFQYLSSEERGKRHFLSASEYLSSVVEPTRQQAEIAPRRVAVHFVTTWVDLIGPELSQRFSTTAALHVLAGIPAINRIGSNESLLQKLHTLGKLIPEETTAERTQIINAVLELHKILLSYRGIFNSQQILKELFLLIGEKHSLIGGEQQALLEIFGLLNSDELHQKLSQDYSDYSDRVAIVENLTSLLLDKLAVSMSSSKMGLDMRLMLQIVHNPQLRLQEILHILASDDVKQTYENGLRKRYRADLERHYAATVGFSKEDPALESLFLDFFARNIFDSSLDESTLNRRTGSLISSIHDAMLLIKRARQFLEDVSEDGRIHEEGYISMPTLNRAKKEVSEDLERVLFFVQNREQSGNLLSLFRSVANNLESEMDGWEKKFFYEKATREITSSINVFVDELGVMHPDLTAQNKRALTIGLQTFFAGYDTVHFDRVMKRIRRLSLELISQVISHQKTLEQAESMLPSEEKDERLSVRGRRLSGKSNVTTASESKSVPEKTMLDNAQLSAVLQIVLNNLEFLEENLNTSNLSEENRKRIEKIIDLLAWVEFDIPNAHQRLEDYDSLLGKITALNERLVQRDATQGIEPSH